MKSLLTNLGPILMLIGVAFLAVYFFGQSNSNELLIGAAAFEIVGFFTYIITNKLVK